MRRILAAAVGERKELVGQSSDGCERPGQSPQPEYLFEVGRELFGWQSGRRFAEDAFDESFRLSKSLGTDNCGRANGGQSRRTVRDFSVLAQLKVQTPAVLADL